MSRTSYKPLFKFNKNTNFKVKFNKNASFKVVLNALLREGSLASQASRDEAFWRSQVNFGLGFPYSFIVVDK